MKQPRINLTENEKVAREVTGLETNAKHFAIDENAANEDLKLKAISKFNDEVDAYKKELDEHAKNLDKYAEEVASSLREFEIKVPFNYILVKPFSENPFQRITKVNGIITDLGGQKPKFKNQDNGQVEEEENLIHVGIVQEAGPECKYVKEGDAIFWTKPSEVPVPFYKQGLVYISELRVLAIVNEGLTKRFNKIKKNGREG